jgi:hypothetical protein
MRTKRTFMSRPCRKPETKIPPTLRVELLAVRREMADLLQQRKIAGGVDRCPTVEERLKENHRAPEKRNRPLRGVIVRR